MGNKEDIIKGVKKGEKIISDAVKGGGDDSFGREVSAEFLRLCAENGLGTHLAWDEMKAAAEKLGAFSELLLSENEKYNLTAIKTACGIAQKHLCDSITPIGYIPLGASVLDCGSGAGFPAVPIAVMRPDAAVTALDATAKKAAFINAAAAKLGIGNLRAAAGRAEELARMQMRAKTGVTRESFDVVTARAVASMRILAELCAPFVRVGGRLIAMKGARGSAESEAEAAAELAAAVGLIRLETVEVTLRGSDANGELSRTLLIYEKRRSTPPEYPRRYGQILKDAKG